MTYEQYCEQAQKISSEKYTMRIKQRQDAKYKHDVYLCGALKNDSIRELAWHLRTNFSYDVFDDWHSAHVEADQLLWAYHRDWRGHSVAEALRGPVATMIRDFDKKHIDSSSVVVLVAPAGKSAHMEIGYAIGQGKGTIYYYPEEPDRFDIMVGMVDHIAVGIGDLVKKIGLCL